MNTLSCSDLQAMACELALDVLDGRDRAAALTHLEGCWSCRSEVSSLTEAADELLLLAPSALPSPGFENRVLARIEHSSTPPAASEPVRHRGWPPRVLAVVVAAVVLPLVILASGVGQSDVAVASTEVRTGKGEFVGHAYLRHDPSSIVLTVPGWMELVGRYNEPAEEIYWLSVERDDGSSDLLPLTPAPGDQSWRVSIDGPVDTVSSVAVVDDQGRVWCSGRFE